MFGGFLVKAIIFYIVGGFILYIVIETAVRRGINHSNIGQFLEKKYGMKEDKKSFLDDDLDNENKNGLLKQGRLLRQPFFRGVNVRTLFIKQIQQDNNDIPQTGSSLSDSTLIQHLSEGDEIRRSRPFFFFGSDSIFSMNAALAFSSNNPFNSLSFIGPTPGILSGICTSKSPWRL